MARRYAETKVRWAQEAEELRIQDQKYAQQKAREDAEWQAQQEPQPDNSLAAQIAAMTQQFAKDRAVIDGIHNEAMQRGQSLQSANHAPTINLSIQNNVVLNQQEIYQAEGADNIQTKKTNAHNEVTLTSHTPSPGVEPTTTQLLLIKEPDPYDNNPNEPWMAASSTVNAATTRSEARSSAKQILAKAVAREEASGFHQVTKQTDCICATSHENNYWNCVTCWLSKPTGETNGNSVGR